MSHITASQLKHQITNIVAEVDVGNISSRQLREMVEDRCGLARDELQSRRQEVNNLTAEVLGEANKLSPGPSSSTSQSSSDGHASKDDEDDHSLQHSSKRPRTSTSPSSHSDHPTSQGLQRTDQGEPYLDLGGNKRVTVSSFKGKLLINIREYYSSSEDPSKMLPGKKGIAINPDQW